MIQKHTDEPWYPVLDTTAFFQEPDCNTDGRIMQKSCYKPYKIQGIGTRDNCGKQIDDGKSVTKPHKMPDSKVSIVKSF